jgi:hypothetical protein
VQVVHVRNPWQGAQIRLNGVDVDVRGRGLGEDAQ